MSTKNLIFSLFCQNMFVFLLLSRFFVLFFSLSYFYASLFLFSNLFMLFSPSFLPLAVISLMRCHRDLSFLFFIVPALFCLFFHRRSFFLCRKNDHTVSIQKCSFFDKLWHKKCPIKAF